MNLQVAFLLLLGTLGLQQVRGQVTSGACVEGTTATSFKIFIRYDTTGTTATGLESYSEVDYPTFTNPAQTGTECTNTNLEAGTYYSLAYEVDTTLALPCGVTEVGVGTGVYRAWFRAIGTNDYFYFDCDSAAPDIPAIVQAVAPGLTLGHTMPTTGFTFGNPAPSVTFEVTDPVGNVMTQVELSRPIKLVLTFDRSFSTAATSTLEVISLKIGNTALFDDMFRDIITNGCNNKAPPMAAAMIGNFKTTVYTNPVKIESDVFRAYRLGGDATAYADVFFRVTYKPCYGDLDQCNLNCARRKRSAVEEEDPDVQTRDVRLRITGTQDTDNQDSADQSQGRTGCGAVVMYWAPHVLLLLIIIVECGVVSYFLFQKKKLL